MAYCAIQMTQNVIVRDCEFIFLACYSYLNEFIFSVSGTRETKTQCCMYMYWYHAVCVALNMKYDGKNKATMKINETKKKFLARVAAIQHKRAIVTDNSR